MRRAAQKDRPRLSLKKKSVVRIIEAEKAAATITARTNRRPGVRKVEKKGTMTLFISALSRAENQSEDGQTRRSKPQALRGKGRCYPFRLPSGEGNASKKGKGKISNGRIVFRNADAARRGAKGKRQDSVHWEGLAGLRPG